MGSSLKHSLARGFLLVAAALVALGQTSPRRPRGIYAVVNVTDNTLIMAVGHAILVIAFHLLEGKENYKELGANFFDEKSASVLCRSLVKRLERLGHTVTLTPIAQSSLRFS